MRCSAILAMSALYVALWASIAAGELRAACSAAAEARVAALVARECSVRQSCSVCALVGDLPACEGQVLCRVLNSTRAASESGDGIHIEEQWVTLPAAADGSSLRSQEVPRVLSTGYVSVDGWQLVDGKPSAVLTLPDDLVAGFQSLSVLDLSSDGLAKLDARLSRDVLAKSSLPLTLVLERNRLVEIPPIVFKLPNLRVLRLTQNAIRQQRLSPAQFAFLSANLTTLEADNDAFQATGCDATVAFQSNPSLLSCDPAQWLHVSNSPTGDSSAASTYNNSADRLSPSPSSSSSWAVWVGAAAAFFVVASCVVCALAKRAALRKLLHPRWLAADDRGDEHGVARYDSVQQQSDAVCYRAFQDLLSDSSTLSLDEQLFEAWRRDPRLVVLLRPLGSSGSTARAWLGTYREEDVVVKTLPDAAADADRASVRWTAPELLRGAAAKNNGVSEAVDIYSFGVILSELDTLEYPFERAQRELKLSDSQLLEKFVDGSLQPTVSASCPAAARELLLACVAHDPSERPTAAIVVQTLRELVSDVSREASIAGGLLHVPSPGRGSVPKNSSSVE
ncbi:hypothetical protein PybrP1_007728 [[Pythium] brassicae (nom. inval.)]|nr:hypothetical protein PybrP1_007728 [[Pythium] brassicae (nom. inval.)]